MKPLAKFLIRLYPTNWRARYGEEFEALLEDSSSDWRVTFDLLKGAIKMQLSVPAFPKLAVMLSIAGLLAGLGISFVVTPRFVSTAVMTLGDSLVTTTTPAVHTDLPEYFLQMETAILSRTSLSAIIQDPNLDLYKNDRAKIPLEDVIEKMRNDIKITREAPGSNYLTFSVTFAYPDRARAQQTVQALITKFMDSNLSRQQTQSGAERFQTSNQIYLLESRVAALEKRLGMPPASHEPVEQYQYRPPAINLDILDPPSLPVAPVYPNRVYFMASGFGAGIVAAMLIAIFRRRLPPLPFPAQTA